MAELVKPKVMLITFNNISTAPYFSIILVSLTLVFALQNISKTKRKSKPPPSIVSTDQTANNIVLEAPIVSEADDDHLSIKNEFGVESKDCTSFEQRHELPESTEASDINNVPLPTADIAYGGEVLESGSPPIHRLSSQEQVNYHEMEASAPLAIEESTKIIDAREDVGQLQNNGSESLAYPYMLASPYNGVVSDLEKVNIDFEATAPLAGLCFEILLPN